MPAREATRPARLGDRYRFAQIELVRRLGNGRRDERHFGEQFGAPRRARQGCAHGRLGRHTHGLEPTVSLLRLRGGPIAGGGPRDCERNRRSASLVGMWR